MICKWIKQTPPITLFVFMIVILFGQKNSAWAEFVVNKGFVNEGAIPLRTIWSILGRISFYKSWAFHSVLMSLRFLESAPKCSHWKRFYDALASRRNTSLLWALSTCAWSGATWTLLTSGHSVSFLVSQTIFGSSPRLVGESFEHFLTYSVKVQEDSVGDRTKYRVSRSSYHWINVEIDRKLQHN